MISSKVRAIFTFCAFPKNPLTAGVEGVIMLTNKLKERMIYVC